MVADRCSSEQIQTSGCDVRFYLMIPVRGVKFEEPLTKPFEVIWWQMSDRSVQVLQGSQ